MGYKEANKYHKVSGEGRRGCARVCTKRRAWISVSAGVALLIFLCLYVNLWSGSDTHNFLKALHLSHSDSKSQKDALWPIQSNQFVNIYDGDFVLVKELDSTQEVSAQQAGASNKTQTCQPFYISGWNSWDIARVARILPRNHKTVSNLTGKKALQKHFAKAAAAGLNVVRAWAHTVDPMYQVMKSPGKYDESGLRAIDFMLYEARKRGIRVILSFVDNWKYKGGVDEMVDFSESAPKRTFKRPSDDDDDFSQVAMNETLKEYEVRRHTLFFTDSDSKKIYRDHVQTLINRRNHYSGILYKDDPTIFAWNLINEPRCESWLVDDCEVFLQNWIREMSLYVKKLDPNHLVTIGSEGFYARDYVGKDEESKLDESFVIDDINPASWAAQTGQDFVANHMLDSIDFATVHLWPDNWNQSSHSFQTKWIDSHVEVARTKLHKPIIVQEFGKKEDPAEKDSKERDEVFQLVENVVEGSALEKGELKGSLFWNWEIDLLVGAKEDPYTLEEGDSTFELVNAHALKMHNLSQSQIYRCDDFELTPLV
mmetsp:Transcript_12908/g.24418  ORF Transcript_12908/g.24418 Transcript_12908/m.24418 type:complete len:540 (-) Transcript_12908:1800-3419(-)|eukprot:CAMPEP_0197469826 /NCGR_PEP_ID=MMETSP1309-20131121/313_1 /TAXON_ID=464262 /ORGANISM="Genus nov. species nov., Strain RCC998" /LENGTH=539 /DNA_ID=CAMNT_0043006119 /DNA_START=180 /DNA_END=1799 /DNA_ORIENTATION=+